MALPIPMGKQLILIEAETAIREQHVRELQASGHTVTALADSVAALKWLRQRPPPDLVLIAAVDPDVLGKDFRQSLILEPRMARVPVAVLDKQNSPIDPGERSPAVAPPASPSGLQRTVEQFARTRKPGILLVDDHGGVLSMLEQALGYFGFAPLVAVGGERALELFRRERAAIDVVLLDVQMVPMDGPQTLAAIQQVDPGVRAAFMSGNTGRFLPEELLALGALRVFAKPFELADLAEDLWRIVEGPAAEPTTAAKPD